MNICGRCGQEITEDSNFCHHCGNVGAPVELTVQRSDSNNMIALILALVPGLFNVFGLGHLYLRRYIKAAVFLCISAVLFIVQFIYDTNEYNTVFTILVFVIFFLQALDVMRINSSNVRLKNV